MNFDGREILFLAKDSKSKFVNNLIKSLCDYCGYWDAVDFRQFRDPEFFLPDIEYVNGGCIEERVVSSNRIAYGVIKARRNRYFCISNRNVKRNI